jgi:hypothetical protein
MIAEIDVQGKVAGADQKCLGVWTSGGSRAFVSPGFDQFLVSETSYFSTTIIFVHILRQNV